MDAVAIVDAGGAFFQPTNRNLIAAMVSTEFREALEVAAQPSGLFPELAVHCGQPGCDQRLGKWRLVPSRGLTEVADQAQRSHEQIQGPSLWSARAASGKGGIEPIRPTSDANGTVAYTCKTCRHRFEVSPQRRTRLFLDALRDRTKRIYLKA